MKQIQREADADAIPVGINKNWIDPMPEGMTRAFISSSYIREESPILSLSWWSWRSCYESVVLGVPFTPARSRTARIALNLVRHYIVTSHAAGLNIVMRGTEWFCGVQLGGVKLPAELRAARNSKSMVHAGTDRWRQASAGKMAAPC